jgi:hypothetical protein
MDQWGGARRQVAAAWIDAATVHVLSVPAEDLRGYACTGSEVSGLVLAPGP